MAAVHLIRIAYWYITFHTTRDACLRVKLRFTTGSHYLAGTRESEVVLHSRIVRIHLARSEPLLDVAS